jgi:hypothetical protein
MRPQSYSGVLAGILAASLACGGPMSAPTSPTTATQGGGAGPPAITIQQAAPALGRQLGQFTITALRELAGQSAPSGVVNGRMATFTGTFAASCPDGGSREFVNLPSNLPFIGQIDLSNVQQVFTSCAFTDGGTRFTANGRINMRGTYWKAERPDQDVRVQGPISLSPIAGEQQVDGRIMQDGSYNGTITGVNVITGPTAPPPPPPASPAQLLAGRWQGRAVGTLDAGIPGAPVCNQTFDLAIELTASTNTTLAGTLSRTIVRSTGDAVCGTVVGAVARVAVTATAGNASVTINLGGGVSLTGEYNASGSWMGGTVNDPVLRPGAQWQAVR